MLEGGNNPVPYDWLLLLIMGAGWFQLHYMITDVQEVAYVLQA